MTVLVTGGCGYIGNYVIRELVKKDIEVIVVDNLSTGYKEALIPDVIFYEADIRDEVKMEEIFQNRKIDLVMDFAAKLIVEESNIEPLDYYDVNVNGLRVVLKTMNKYNVKNIIFSSTAAVYGLLDKKNKLIEESDLTIPSNPYGETKLAGEKMIEWASKAYGINYIIFRYFNVAGGKKIGAKIEEFTTIIPRIINSVKNNEELSIFGNDYDTEDGTCIRDFIHIEDLVSAHILAVENFSSINSGVYNLSIGRGISILELIKATEVVLNKKVNYKYAPRRIGDPVISAASNKKFIKESNWIPKYTKIEDIVKLAYDSWN